MMNAMHIRGYRTLLACAVVVALAAVGPARADDARIATDTARISAPNAAAANPAVEQRVREELRTVMLGLIETGAFGRPPAQQISLDVDAPAQRVSNLGVVVDTTSGDKEGLRVLAVTPDGGGQHMGLHAGDRLLALNGQPLTGADAAMTLRRTIDALPDGGALAFDVHREGSTQTVSGTLASIYLPAMHLTVGDGRQVAANTAVPTAPAAPAADPGSAQGCARISDFDVAPRQKNLHAAKIIAIDGAIPGPQGARSYRVSAGTHTLTVSEHIESRYLNMNDSARNIGSTRYKKLVVDAPPNTLTLIAAHLNQDNNFGGKWQNGAYWDPVAWQQTSENCR